MLKLLVAIFHSEFMIFNVCIFLQVVQGQAKKRKNFSKFRSKSSPTPTRYARKEENMKFASLRDDLDKSLLQMDLLAKGLMTFSKAKIEDR